MPGPAPLTAETLKQFVADQQEIEAGIAEDCAAIEDMLVRLAGPALQGIEDDTAALQEIVDKLSEPIVTGTRKDTQQLLRMARKLVAPIDAGISEDTTVLTAIAARAYGARFPHAPGMRVVPGSDTAPRKVVSGQPHSPARHSSASNGTPGMGVPGLTSNSTAGRAPGHTPGGPTRLPPLLAVGAAGVPHTFGHLAPSPAAPPSPPQTLEEEHGLPPHALDVVSGAGGGGVVALGGSGYGPGAPQAEPLAPTPQAEPLAPFGHEAGGAIGGDTIALYPKGTSGFGSDFPPPPPPPPLPQPPLDRTDLCACVLHLAAVMGGQLSAIAQALYALRPDAPRTATPGRTGRTEPAGAPAQPWREPPDDSLLLKETESPFMDDASLDRIIAEYTE